MPNLYHYFQRACAHDPLMLEGICGEKLLDEDGNSVVWCVQLDEGGRIDRAGYRCTTCMTLVGLCEHLSELLTGMKVEAARMYTVEKLLALHPEVPSARRERAVLALDALQSALEKQRVTNGACT